jgi:hypothetical protein
MNKPVYIYVQNKCVFSQVVKKLWIKRLAMAHPLEPNTYILSILSVEKPWQDSWIDTATQEMEFDWMRHMFVCRIVQSKCLI